MSFSIKIDSLHGLWIFSTTSSQSSRHIETTPHNTRPFIPRAMLPFDSGYAVMTPENPLEVAEGYFATREIIYPQEGEMTPSMCNIEQLVKQRSFPTPPHSGEYFVRFSMWRTGDKEKKQFWLTPFCSEIEQKVGWELRKISENYVSRNFMAESSRDLFEQACESSELSSDSPEQAQTALISAPQRTILTTNAILPTLQWIYKICRKTLPRLWELIRKSIN